MKRGRLAISAILLFGAWPLGPCLGAEPDKIPPIALPTPLKPYGDQGKVIEAAESVIRLVGTARFDEPTTDSPLAKAPCDVPGIAAFYRGMTLMQAGYFMFISKMERGFESTESPHLALGEGFALVPTTFGALVKPGRELLVAVWDKEKLARLLSLVTAVRDSPPAVKADLAAYFSALQEFGQRYDALKRRAPAELAKLNKRSTRLYSYEREDELVSAKLKGERELRLTEAEYPERVFYEEYAKEMRTLLDANRDIGHETVSECMDGGHFAAVHIGGKGEITYSPYGLYPASYMIGFWQRRESEGTSLLARFAIDRLLAELKRPN